ncbi:14 kDa proline-rich protein DC2.15-like [Cucurbita maxima]|uniref:14 kDa proline-rich protein DC2.15-like n=1 Tax=Cucurbita maxima TaxID=3661 RepID=A0A6J1KZP7_CUCMA|nr:14 kDa proline-rich protein DC2.15-like [Cucurbita maxima]
MDSKRTSNAAIFLVLNLVFFAFVNVCHACDDHAPKPKPKPKPYPNPNPTPVVKSCPRDALKLGVCTKLLNGPVSALVGSLPNTQCCSLLDGLIDLEAAVCLCTAIKANILGININIPISLSLLVNVCGKKVPSEFQCA